MKRRQRSLSGLFSNSGQLLQDQRLQRFFFALAGLALKLALRKAPDVLVALLVAALDELQLLLERVIARRDVTDADREAAVHHEPGGDPR